MFSIVVKDYLNSLHELALATDYVTFFGLIKATFMYVIQSTCLALYYVLSFHWLRDFMELPVAFKHTYTVILQGHGVVRWESFVKLSVKNGAFSFLDTSPANRHSLFSGFFNSFFLSLPLSVVHIVTLRALLVNGSMAGLFSFFGSFCGQFIFYFCMLFGFEFIMQPLFQFDIIIIGLGCFITIELIYRLTNFPDYQIFTIRDLEPLLNFFKLSFILGWFEQVCVCNYFGNISVSPVYSMLETTNSRYFLFITLFYFIGLMIGYILWSSAFYFLVVQLRAFVTEKLTEVSFFEINQKIHYSCVIGLLVMTMSSFFYYGYDFFVNQAFGYVAEDEAMAWMAPTNKRYVEITAMMEEAEEDEEETESDVLIDGKPFQTGDERAEISFELFGIPSENDEINKELSLDRFDEKTGLFRSPSKTKFPYKDNPNYYQDEEPEYVTKDFDFFDYGSNTYTPREQLYTFFLNSAFRNDEYDALRDKKSNSYLPETQVYRQFREKYTTNILYRKLMQLNNLSFLSGQPKTSSLSTADEFSLYHRRTILQAYLNSIHRYKHIIQSKGVSFPERVYNQQFKGSLNFVRKFNAVELTEYHSPEMPKQYFDRYDMLFGEGDEKQINTAKGRENKILKYDQPLYKKSKKDQLALLHEELPFKPRHLKQKRFLKPNDTRPLYIGWDNVLRKFMIKSAIVGPGLQSDIRERKDVVKVSGESENIEEMEGQVQTNKTKQTKQTKKGVKKGVKKRVNPNSRASRAKPHKRSLWKRIFRIKDKKPKRMKLKADKDICENYAPVKKRSVKEKRNLPDYFHFQAWIPGTETTDPETKFKLPSLILDDKSREIITEQLELLPEEEEIDPDDFLNSRETRRRMAMQKSFVNAQYEQFIPALPIYDWYWSILDLEDAEYVPAFRFGDLTPPKLDGIAWPGQNPRYGLTCPTFSKD